MGTSNVVMMQKGVEVAEPKVESALTTMLSEIQGLPKDELEAEIFHEAQSRGLNMIRLGGLLERAEAELDTSNFLKWCFDAYGIEGHQVHAYRRAYRVAAHSGLDLDALSALDTYKLTKLLPQVVRPLPKVTLGPASPGNVETYEANQKWLDKAMSMTRAELSAAIAEAKDKPGAKATQFVFKMQDPDNAADVKKVLGELKELGQVGGAALNALAVSYLCGGKPPMLEAMMKKAGPVEAMETFAKLWPEIDVKVTTP